MKSRTTCICLMASLVCVAASAQAAIVRVEIHGTIDVNLFFDGPMAAGLVNPGDPVILEYDVDSTAFTISPYYNNTVQQGQCHSGGYDIVPGSFTFRVGSVDVPQDENPPDGAAPYWALRNDDPGVDGVFGSNDPAYCDPTGLPVVIDAAGGPFGVNFSVSLGNGLQPDRVFTSLDILQAVGYMGPEWLTDLNFTIDSLSGAGTPVYMNFDSFSMTELSPPTLTQQPAPADLCPGNTASFSVAAIEADSYQWRRNGTPLVDGADTGGATISGATTATIAIANISNSQQGQYDCIVSNGPIAASPYGLAQSNPAQLTIWASCVAGDIDCDQFVGLSDVDAFVQALLNPSAPTACNPHNGDINHDGLIDGADIAPFIRLIVP